jgi:hypothetical protein
MPDAIQLIGALLDKIGAQADVEESAEWYLRSYLIDYKRVLLRKASRQEIEFATDALMRFCVQSFEVSAPLRRDCVQVMEAGRRWQRGA